MLTKFYFQQATILKVNVEKEQYEIKFKDTNKPVDIVNHNYTIKFVNPVEINENDMAEIDEINEVDLFNNIKNRFFTKNIFNNVGPTIIIVNPCQPIDSNSNEVLEDYVKVNY